ncbi:MAG: peroxidase family protein, partial [Bacteroidota bacterium]
RDSSGQEISHGHILLRDGFFNPDALHGIGLDPYFMGMATQLQQDLDSKVVEDVRNFLFGAPGSGGLDLASINIQRGRERGIPDFNSIRREIGLSPYDFFHQISADSDVFEPLRDIYGGNINNIDAWVGMLAEGHMPNAIFGPTIMRLMEQQFRALRDGDRYYFENDPHLAGADKARIRDVRLRDVINRNTSLNIQQENVFVVVNPENLCATMDIDGNLFTEEGSPVTGIELFLNSEDTDLNEAATDQVGSFLFEGVENCLEYTLRPNTSALSALHGVTTFDLILLRQHILGTALLDSPYKLLAADTNDSGSITTSDVVELRKLILNIQSQLPNNRNWHFIPADYEFVNPTNPFSENIPEFVTIDLANNSGVEFIAVKIGDLNGSAAQSFGNIQARAAEVIDVQLQYAGPQDDGYEHFYLNVKDFEDVNGFQFTLNYDNTSLELVDMVYGDVRQLSEANFYSLPTKGAITASWNTTSTKAALKNEGNLVELIFRSNKTIENPCDLLEINSSITASEVYLRSRPNIQATMGLSCNIASVELYQNYPNPFKDITTIPFRLNEPMQATLSVYDVSGKLLHRISNDYAAGKHEVQVERAVLNTTSNVAIYKLETEQGVIGKKMILLD